MRRLWERLWWPREALSNIERDVARIQWAQAETLARLREVKTQLDRITEHPRE